MNFHVLAPDAKDPIKFTCHVTLSQLEIVSHQLN